MSPTIHHKYKYFYSTVQRAKDRRQKSHICRLPSGVTSSLISLFSAHSTLILLTLLICCAFLCVDVFCLNATRTDLCRVRVLFSRAQPFGPPLSKMHKEGIHVSVKL